MDTLAAAPIHPRSSLEYDIAPPAASSIPWISFGGAPNESSTAFVQSLQRVGFQQRRGRDDGWMAEYAAACFEGAALIWYTDLDEEVQESWKKLRTKLLRSYPTVAGGGSPPFFSIPQPASIPSAPGSVGVGASSASPSHPQGLSGIVEVVGRYTVLQGCISFDPISGIYLTTDKDKAVLVSFPQTKGKDVLQLDMLSIPSRAFPYLGLALLSPQGKDPNVVPDLLPGVSSYNYGNISIPEPLSSCKHGVSTDSGSGSTTKAAFATWRFFACGSSRKATLCRRRSPVEVAGIRAAAAVWKYNISTEELNLHWLMDDDTECEVGGYVHNGTSDQLHVHRVSDMDKTGGYILEERVRFVFCCSQ